ncbi:Elf1p [Sporobolomyces salmoneus]|uniref:Elf1p n=1 Tax=Sporobolomyces salmoneus TaxID=183962 RepID=UPI003170D646
MGKRKSSKKPQARIKQVLDKSFRCIFCAHQGSVTCKMDNKAHIGRLDCKDCGQSYSMDISHLDQPVDVYSSWIDAASEANNGGGGGASSSGFRQAQDDSEPRAAASSSRTTKKKQPQQKKRSRKEAADSNEDEESEEDDGDFDPRKKRRPAAGSDDEEQGGGGDEDEEEEAQESDQDLPDMDISKQKSVKKTRVVEDEDED